VNSGFWRARPILVSGSQAYRAGEWLYQDFLYDDHGATGEKDSKEHYGLSTNLYSPSAGTFTYPRNKKLYANNAADLVELRVRPRGTSTAFRITLNTLKDPALSAFTIALGTSGSSVSWPYGAGVSSPAHYFLTWHGHSVDFRNAGSGKRLRPNPRLKVYKRRRQIQVVVPHGTWNPGRRKVRTTIGIGLWDKGTGGYLQPQPGDATKTTPGGGTPNGVALFNVGPRFDEPWPVFAGATLADTAATTQALAPSWRERQQSEQLSIGDVSPFFANVDFAKLAAKKRDNSGVPKSGPMDRIFASHFSFGQGMNPKNVCFDLAASFSAGAKCIGRDVGQLQPYGLYVPKKRGPKGWGLTLLLHSLSTNYNQYMTSRNQIQLADRGPGSIVLTPEGRGPDGFYAGVAEADTFEAWADVARHYKLDRSWTQVSGYSMGGFGTYRMLARWPDLFSRGFAVVGAPGSVGDQLISIRNDPLLLWNVDGDELVNLQTSENAVSADTAAGLRFEEDLFTSADHLTLAANDQFAPGARFLGTHAVDHNPARVSFVVDSTEDSKRVVADHAYWISGLRKRGKGDATIDVFSKGFGGGIPRVKPIKEGGGALTGGEVPALAYISRAQSWGKTPTARKRDALVVHAKNLRTVTIDVARARVSCGATLDVHTNGRLTVTLAGCGKTLHFH
jgi:pimeloyl-ACP methyl ester carboxylesterase